MGVFRTGTSVRDTSRAASGFLRPESVVREKSTLALSQTERERGTANTESVSCHPNTAGPPCSVTLATPRPMAGWREVLKEK